MKMNARATAVVVLGEVDERGARSAEALSSALDRHPGCDVRDRALATELLYGTLRQRRRLDHALAPLVRQGLEQLEPMARDLLRVGAYQILILDRIPTPVAVSATQDAARTLGAGRLTGLLNAVLRRLGREGESLPGGSSSREIGIRTSLPDWVIGELKRAFGEAAAELEAAALRERPQTTIRPTIGRGGAPAVIRSLEAEGFSVRPGRVGTLTVAGPGDPFSTESFRAGGFVPQDPASLAIVDILGDVDGASVLDLCAGRGIKATALADRGARVTAVDVIASKLRETEQLAERLGCAAGVATRHGDPTGPGLDLGEYDHVLVDAPCTGLGTIRRRPEIAWRVRPEDPARLAELQRRLVEAGARHVSPGGQLLYAVCTFTRAEILPAAPAGFEPAGGPLRWLPSEGFDAFFAHRWRRAR